MSAVGISPGPREVIRVKVGEGYDVLTGRGLLAESGTLIRELLGKAKVAVVTDSNVAQLWLEPLMVSLRMAGISVCSHVIPAGEEHKTLDTFGEIVRFFAENGLDRSDVAVALGGGVVGDMTGFAAGCYMRGIRYVQMPTTLLAAVDSSVGGKTAVDLPTGKNLVGVFHQPSMVICDADCLRTLPEVEWKNGMAEVVKTAVLSGGELFEKLESGEETDPVWMITRCVRYKSGVVERDEREQGERKLLNLGHTAGHAIECCSGYEIPHGLAVSMGLAIITRSAARAGQCSEDTAKRILNTLKASGLPLDCGYTAAALAEAALADKKRHGDSITLIIPGEIGGCRLEKVPAAELTAIFAKGTEA